MYQSNMLELLGTHNYAHCNWVFTWYASACTHKYNTVEPPIVEPSGVSREYKVVGPQRGKLIHPNSTGESGGPRNILRNRYCNI